MLGIRSTTYMLVFARYEIVRRKTRKLSEIRRNFSD